MDNNKNGSMNGQKNSSNERNIYENYQVPTYKNPPSMPPVKPARSEEKDK